MSGLVDVDPVALIAIVAFGLVVGSFINVVIFRLPERRSLWSPRSSCRGCGTLIRWYDNVPVVSFLLLRGRCRTCGKRISWQYPAVELSTAALWGLAYLVLGPSAYLVVALVFLATLVAVTAIDLEHQIIPDRITLPGIVAGFLANLATGHVPWIEALLGILIGGGIFFVIILVSGGGMGGGDMKLGAMFGAFLGWKVTLVAIFAAVLIGGTVAVVLLVSRRRGRKDPVPFGPFLAIGGAIGMLWGERIVAWYVSGFPA